MSFRENYRVSRVAIGYFYINKVLGIFPFSYDHCQKIFKTSFPSVLYSLLLAISTVFLYSQLINSFQAFLDTIFTSPLAKFISVFQSVYLCFEIVCVQLINIYYGKSLVNYLNNKFEFELRLNLVSKKIYRKNYYALLSLSTSVIFGMKMILNYLLITTWNDAGGLVVLAACLHMIPYAAGTLIGCSFSMEVISLRSLAAQINYTLMELSKTFQDLPERVSRLQKLNLSCQTCDKVDELMTLHSQLNKTIKKYNEFQNIVLFLYYSNKFMEIIIPIFYEYLYFMGHSKIETTFGAYVISSKLNVLNSIELMTTACCSQKLFNEMRKTGRILHEFPVHQTDSRLKESIYRFSTQILQENRPISIFGMFTVDNTLLYAMVSAMTSYLILLIQFQQQESQL
ncbi:7TM chemoreceptor [Sergentomyia squamirostris]